MFYISKCLQLLGLIVIGIGFIFKFPQLMDYNLLGFGVASFIMGWIVQKYGLNEK